MHQKYTLLMSAALDDEVTAAELQSLHEHLRGCAECSETWRQWRRLDRRFAAAPMLAAPAGLADQVFARLDAAELRRRRARWLGSGLLIGWLSLVAAVAVGVVLLLPWLRETSAQFVQLRPMAASWIEALALLARGAWAVAASLGAPSLAAAMGLLACATCVLGATWLRLISERGGLRDAALPVAR